MPINTGVPSSTRKPGSFVKLDEVSGGRGLVPIQRRVAFLAAKLTAGTATVEQPVRVYDRKESETLFGKGSELDLMVKQALRTSARLGFGPEIYGVPIAEPGGGTQATRTFTITGAQTEAGDVEVKVAGRTIRAGVAIGDSNNTVASSLKTAIDRFNADSNAATLPATASVATNVVTLTANNKGVNGSDIKLDLIKAPAGLVVTVNNAVIAGAGAYDITNGLASLVDKHYHAVATSNHTSTDVTDFVTFLDSMALSSTKKWSFSYIGETGTLSAATTLATAANRMDEVFVSGENFRSLPGELAAWAAVRVESQEDPALHFNSREADVFGPPAASDVPTDAEIETAIAGGVSILSVNAQGNPYVVRMVTSKTTHASVPFEKVLSLTAPRTFVYMGIQVAAALDLFLVIDENKKLDAATLARCRDVVFDVLKQAETLRFIHNVDAHAPELIVEVDAIVTTRINVAWPVSVIPELNQIATLGTLYVEAPILAAA